MDSMRIYFPAIILHLMTPAIIENNAYKYLDKSSYELLRDITNPKIIEWKSFEQLCVKFLALRINVICARPVEVFYLKALFSTCACSNTLDSISITLSKLQYLKKDGQWYKKRSKLEDAPKKKEKKEDNKKTKAKTDKDNKDEEKKDESSKPKDAHKKKENKAEKKEDKAKTGKADKDDEDDEEKDEIKTRTIDTFWLENDKFDESVFNKFFIFEKGNMVADSGVFFIASPPM